LGGEDFDRRLLEHFKKDLEDKHGKSIDGNVRALYRLQVACERTKKLLSTNTEATIEIDSLDGIDYISTITRCIFEQLCDDLFSKTVACIEHTLETAKLSKKGIDEVILVGGSTRIPKIRSMITNMFSEKQMNFTNDIDDVVVHGAAIQAAILSSNTSSTFLQSIKISDISPIALGILVHLGTVQTVVEKWSPLQKDYAITLKRPVDQQSDMRVQILGGISDSCTVLKEYHLSDIFTGSQIKRGCIIGLNADGILNLFVKKANKKIIVNEIQIRFTETDIERMQQEAAAHRQSDDKQKENRTARAELGDYILKSQQKLMENTIKLTEKQRKAIYSQCANKLKFLDDNRVVDTKELMKRLEQMHKKCGFMFKTNEVASKKLKKEGERRVVVHEKEMLFEESENIQRNEEIHQQNRAERVELENCITKAEQIFMVDTINITKKQKKGLHSQYSSKAEPKEMHCKFVIQRTDKLKDETVEIIQNEADQEQPHNREARANLQNYIAKCEKKLIDETNKLPKKQESKIRYQCSSNLKFLDDNPEVQTKKLVERLQQMKKICG
jgi:hypothetical protein